MAVLLSTVSTLGCTSRVSLSVPAVARHQEAVSETLQVAFELTVTSLLPPAAGKFSVSDPNSTSGADELLLQRGSKNKMMKEIKQVKRIG